jgi:hypothetical protein
LFLSKNQQEKALFYQKASTLKIQTWFPAWIVLSIVHQLTAKNSWVTA